MLPCRLQVGVEKHAQLQKGLADESAKRAQLEAEARAALDAVIARESARAEAHARALAQAEDEIKQLKERAREADLRSGAERKRKEEMELAIVEGEATVRDREALRMKFLTFRGASLSETISIT